jgi:hypothetical protein
VDTTRIDSLAKMLAAGGTRRRLVKTLAVLGIGGVVGRSAARVAAEDDGCKAVTCQSGYYLECYYSQKTGKCTGCKCHKYPSTGITGGGLVHADGGAEAHLLLFATRTADPAVADSFLVQGQLLWTDPAWEGTELKLESVQITGYGPTEGAEGSRDVYGWVRASGVDAVVPFFLQAVDAGGPGSGQDTVNLLVGDAVPTEAVLGATAASIGFSYTAKGTLVSGDLSLVTFGSTGEAVPGTPAE